MFSSLKSSCIQIQFINPHAVGTLGRGSVSSGRRWRACHFPASPSAAECIQLSFVFKLVSVV